MQHRVHKTRVVAFEMSFIDDKWNEVVAYELQGLPAHDLQAMKVAFYGGAGALISGIMKVTRRDGVQALRGFMDETSESCQRVLSEED